MKHSSLKLKQIYLPYIAILLGMVLGFSLLRWALDIKLGILPLKEEMFTIYLPILLPWIPILIVLRKRLQLLRVNDKNHNGHFFYQFIIWISISLPMILAQHYLEKVSYSLIRVPEPRQVFAHSREKYFEIDQFQIEKHQRLPYVTARTSGRNNEYLTYYLFIACPFRDIPNLWYGVEFNEKFSNRISDSEKDKTFNDFIQNAEKEFDTYNFHEVNHFKRLGLSDERDGYIAAIEEAFPNINKKKQVILVPKSTPFQTNSSNTLLWVIGSFGGGCLILFIMVMIPKIDTAVYKGYLKNKKSKKGVLDEIPEFLNPTGPNKYTAILILSNILVFMAMMFAGLNIISPTPQELLEIGGNRRLEILNGEYWRLVSSQFIHGGIMHLIVNIYGLAIGAVLLEGMIKPSRLLFYYLLCGIVASIASVIWHENSVSVGASGAIFGLYGIILAFTVFKVYPKIMLGTNWKLLGVYVGLSLLIGITGGIDNAAHIGGLISGCIIGSIVAITQKTNTTKTVN